MVKVSTSDFQVTPEGEIAQSVDNVSGLTKKQAQKVQHTAAVATKLASRKPTQQPGPGPSQPESEGPSGAAGAIALGALAAGIAGLAALGHQAGKSGKAVFKDLVDFAKKAGATAVEAKAFAEALLDGGGGPDTRTTMVAEEGAHSAVLGGHIRTLPSRQGSVGVRFRDDARRLLNAPRMARGQFFTYHPYYG